MTKSTKVLIDIADLTAFRMECNYCHSSITLPMAAIDRGIPERCPNCRESWGASNPQVCIQNIAVELRQLLMALKGAVGFKLSFEIEGLASGGKD